MKGFLWREPSGKLPFHAPGRSSPRVGKYWSGGRGGGIGLDLNPEALARRHIVYSVPFCFGWSATLETNVCINCLMSLLFRTSFMNEFLAAFHQFSSLFKEKVEKLTKLLTSHMSSLCVLGCDPRHRCGCLMHYCSCPVRRGQQHQREKEQIRESLWHS